MIRDLFEIEPTAEHSATVIWLHGLGASNRDFEDIVPHLSAAHVRFVFPSAPIRPVTINGGFPMPAWYDLLGLGDPPAREDAATVRDGARLVHGTVEDEIARGVPAERIVLLGFSQGGAMSLHVGTRFGQRLAGIGVLSGYLLMPDTLEHERDAANDGTALFFAHGRHDPVVPYSLGLRSFERVRALGYPAELHSFDMEHSMCLEEVRALDAWLGRVLPKV